MNTSLIEQLVSRQRDYFNSGESRNLQFRLAMLSRLKDVLDIVNKICKISSVDQWQ